MNDNKEKTTMKTLAFSERAQYWPVFTDFFKNYEDAEKVMKDEFGVGDEKKVDKNKVTVITTKKGYMIALKKSYYESVLPTEEDFKRWEEEAALEEI